MIKINERKYISFDASTKVSSSEITVNKSNLNYLKKLKSNLIPRGSGLSYSLVSAGEKILSVKFNEKIFILNKNKLLVKISTSASIGESVERLMNEGFSFYVLPGHPNITIGGAISCDVHGKNQNKYGNFGQYIKKFKLYHPKKGIIECSKTKNNKIYNLTIGGYGLTGIIIEADIKIKKLESLDIITNKKKINNLLELKDIYNDNIKECEGAYSWHDLNNKKKFGQGFVFFEKFSPKYGQHKTINKINISLQKPNFLWGYLKKFYGKVQNNFFYLYNNLTLNKLSIKNYYYSNFSNKKIIYFLTLRAQGFIEKQIIVPINFWSEFCKFLENNTKEIYCYLTICKFSFGKKKFLRFSGKGINIALNFSVDKKSLNFSKKLDKFCKKRKIILNIYKDSYVSANTVKSIFGKQYQKFSNLLNKYDKERMFSSSISTKLKI